MEWVEVTGKTVEAAQAAALDHLGVHESEAEFDVVSEGRAGVFGLFSQDARVRARVLPKQPRPKQERRPRKGKGGPSGGGGRGSGGRGGKSGGKTSGRAGRGSEDAASGGNRTGGDKRSKTDRSKADRKGPRQNRSGSTTPQAEPDGQTVGQGNDGAASDPNAADSPADRSKKTDDARNAAASGTSADRGPRQRNRKSRSTSPDSGSKDDVSTTASADSDKDAETSSTKKPSAARAGVGAGAVVAGVGTAGAVQANSSSDRRPSTASRDKKQEETMSTDEITVEQQGEIASDFLDGLLEAFGADGEIKSAMVDDDVIEVAVHGKDLGLMIGPKGATLHAIQELARTAVQRSGQGTHRGRLVLDVGGYRQHRRAALEQFAGQVAERVIAENKEHALEPMNAADRKAIHDAVNEIDGVRTISEGEDPRRRIVILPAD